MNALIKSSLLGLALVSTASIAANFAGPEAGASVTMNGGSTFFGVNAYDPDSDDGIFGQQSFGVKLHGGYGFDTGKDTVVLVGFDYSPTSIKAGTAAAASFKIKNSWSLSFAPGIVLNETSMAYIKLSYEGAKLNVSGNDDFLRINKSISGFGYGIGFRTKINKTTFLGTDIKRVNYKKFHYSNKTDAADLTNSTTVGSVGVVFKF
jgi:opacity protein-like surface antigen